MHGRQQVLGSNGQFYCEAFHKPLRLWWPQRKFMGEIRVVQLKTAKRGNQAYCSSPHP